MEEFTQCPEIRVLERYVSGSLSSEEKASFGSHLQVCGICGVIVERLRELDAESAATPEVEEPNWEQMGARLEDECRRVRASRYPERARRHWLTGSLWFPALGYGLAVALLYPAWLGITRQPSPQLPSESPPPVQQRLRAATSGAIVDLNTTRDEQRLPVVAEGAKGRTAVLSFFVPAPSEVRLAAAILDSTNKPVHDIGEITSYDGRGNYCVVVDARALPIGRYQLVVKEVGGSDQAQASFEFERR